MRLKASFIIGFIAAIPAFAQAPNDSPVDFRGGWTWEQLYHIPNVDTGRVTWLRNNLS